MLEFLRKIKATDNTVYTIAVSVNGNLGIASKNVCAHIMTQDGSLLNKICAKKYIVDVSYCCGKFGFISLDDYVYITDENGKLIDKIKTESVGGTAITMIDSGFVACGSRCVFYDYNGNKKWSVRVWEPENGPAYYNGYWYVTSWFLKKLIIIKDGKKINEIYYREPVHDAKVCGKYLAVGTHSRLILYNLDDPANPEEIWSVDDMNYVFQISFNPDCSFMAVANQKEKELVIFSISGIPIMKLRFGREVYPVTWWKDEIIVGLDSGEVYIFKPSFSPIRCSDSF